jgi:hypothetical protein
MKRSPFPPPAMKLVKFSPSAPAAGCRMPDARFPIADSRDQTPAASGAPTFWLAGTAPLSNDSCPLTVPAHRGRLGRRQPVADSALRISDFGLRAACFIRHSLFALLTAVALTASAQSESVYVVVEHIQRVQAAAGDFDGDGRSDFFLLDPVSGAVRIAYQTAPTEFTWQPAVGSGVSNITGVAVGHILLTNRPALAVTGPDANRVNVLSLTGTPPVPVTALPAGLGPSALVALDIGGGGSTPHHDLLVATRWNSPPNTSEIESLRSNRFGVHPPRRHAAGVPCHQRQSRHHQDRCAAGRGLRARRRRQFRTPRLARPRWRARAVVGCRRLPRRRPVRLRAVRPRYAPRAVPRVRPWHGESAQTPGARTRSRQLQPRPGGYLRPRRAHRPGHHLARIGRPDATARDARRRQPSACVHLRRHQRPGGDPADRRRSGRDLFRGRCGGWRGLRPVWQRCGHQ